jgi:hypothetical protein
MSSESSQQVIRACLERHLEGARVSVKRAIVVAASIAVGTALLFTVYRGLTSELSADLLALFFVCAIFFLPLVAPIPFAIRYVGVSRVEDLRRKLDASAVAIAHASVEDQRVQTFFGALAMQAIYAGLVRVVVSTTPGEDYALYLPAADATRLAQAFPLG